MFTVGQKVRLIRSDFFPHKGKNVFTVTKAYNAYVWVEGLHGGWDVDRFIPFEWQEGDAFKIVKTGFGLGPDHVFKCGHLIEKMASSAWAHNRCWHTDIPRIYCPEETYYVGESQIEFIQPNGNTSIDVSVSQTVMPTLQAVNPCVASEPKGRRYLNKAV